MKYDIIQHMKRSKFLPILMGAMIALAGCQTSSDQVVVEQEYVPDCVGDACSIIRYAMPNGNDLMLETANHVINITAQAGTPYTYYVWAGNKTMADEPDMVVENTETGIFNE